MWVGAQFCDWRPENIEEATRASDLAVFGKSQSWLSTQREASACLRTNARGEWGNQPERRYADRNAVGTIRRVCWFHVKIERYDFGE
jgi:hypothetical protein